ncbi:uncharacterized protein LOC114759827 [Neltuma alba]|uniref:uncharacterized protein LOC114759827 n=1 Tax=Neltuma alba TaxID=207710 RepID=UPI0010A2FCF1|nr:uncharacterized protein LOC114759827 [Prosopis alba]
MVSKGHKRTAMCRNLRLLRSITKSHARQRDSELLEGLKRRLEKLCQAVVAKEHDIIDYDPMPVLTVEEGERGFLIRVLSQRSCHGLLTFILEAFEELGLDILSARVNCVDGFCLEALGVQEDNDYMDAQVVQQTLFQAIQNWRQLTNQ